MTPAQFAALDMLFSSGFKPAIWGSDKAGWRIGPHLVDTRTKKNLERQGWIQSESSRIDDGATVDRLVWTEEEEGVHCRGWSPGSAWRAQGEAAQSEAIFG